MNLAEIKASDKQFLTPADVSEIVGVDPQSLRLQARQKPEMLGFPVVVIGTRTKIPRIPFLRFIGECE